MKKRLLFAALLGSHSLLGEADTYFLNEKETVSDLLYNRLKISPIYRSGYLKKTLDYNNLDFQRAQKLKIGTEIKLPSGLPAGTLAIEPETKSEAVPVVEPSVETEVEEVSTPNRTTFKQKWIAGFVFEYLKGKSSDSSFSIQVTRPTLSYYLEKTFNDHSFEMQLTGSYFYLFADENRVGPNSNPLGEAALGYSYSFRPNFSAGLKGQYENEFYLQAKGGDKYQILFPWVYSVGPMVKFGSQQDWTLSYLVLPGQSIRSGLKTKHNYNLKLMHEHKFFDHNFQFGLNYMDNSTNVFNGQKYGVSFGYVF